MEKQEIVDLITESLTSFKDSLLQEVDKKNSGLASNLSKDLKKTLEQIATKPESAAQEESTESKLSLKALQTQISDLTKQLEEKDKQAFLADRNSAISQLIAGSDAVNKSALQKLINAQYADRLKKEDNNWFYSTDEATIPLDKLLQDYLTSDEGKFFVPASPTQGSGTTPGQKPSMPGKEKSADDIWAEAAAKYNAQ